MQPICERCGLFRSLLFSYKVEYDEYCDFCYKLEVEWEFILYTLIIQDIVKVLYKIHKSENSQFTEESQNICELFVFYASVYVVQKRKFDDFKASSEKYC